MKVIRANSGRYKDRQTFTSKDIDTVFEGTPSGTRSRRLHLVTYSGVVDLENAVNTYAFPATFHDVSFPKVEIVVKS